MFDRRRQQPAPDYIKMTQLGESQFVEFKRAAVEAKHLAEDLVALANADGGTVLIGVEDDGSISGIEGYRDNVDELLRAPYIHCVPPVEANSDMIVVGDRTVLALNIAYSTQVHETTSKAVYLRVGRKNQRLGVNDILRLAYAKGQASFESKGIEDAGFEDLDQALVADYCARIGAAGDPREVLWGRDLLVRRGERLLPTVGCVLLFAQKPQRYLPRCGMDILKFEGVRQLVGQELNIVKREIIERPLPRLIQRALEVIGMQVRDYSRLGHDGVFHTTPEYPSFAWQEAIVNAVDYSFTVTLKNASSHATIPVMGAPVDRLRQYLRQHRWISSQEYQRLFAVDRQTAWRQLTRLVRDGELMRDGRGRYTRYGLPPV